MKQYFFLLTIALITLSACGCPCGFSPDDPRPFFEQYEIENNNNTTNEKDKKP